MFSGQRRYIWKCNTHAHTLFKRKRWWPHHAFCRLKFVSYTVRPGSRSYTNLRFLLLTHQLKHTCNSGSAPQENKKDHKTFCWHTPYYTYSTPLYIQYVHAGHCIFTEHAWSWTQIQSDCALHSGQLTGFFKGNFDCDFHPCANFSS